MAAGITMDMLFANAGQMGRYYNAKAVRHCAIAGQKVTSDDADKKKLRFHKCQYAEYHFVIASKC